MKKEKIISAATAASLFISPIYIHASAKERGGCSLIPVSCDETGVMPDSVYTLSGDIGENPIITINDSITATITKNGGIYTVTPDAPLTYNKLYTFTLLRDEPVSWTFQTAEKFCVERTLPGTSGYNVPVTTGIEITFSHKNYDIDTVAENVTFLPEIGGKWEQHDKTAVFVPDKPLENDTSYTVEISGEIANADGQALDAPYSFDFTTESASDTEQNKSFAFYSSISYTETAPGADMSVSYTILSDTKSSAYVISDVYKLPTDEALRYFSNATTLSEAAKKCEIIVQHKEEAVQLNSNMYFNEYTLNINNNLVPGFYLIKASLQNSVDYVLFQVTDTAAYVVKDRSGYTVWLNSFNSGKPVIGAKVITDSGVGAVTDSNGIAKIGASKDDSIRYIVVSKTDLPLGYYPINQTRIIQEKLYHTVLNTDRSIYKTNDTVKFWGIVKDAENDTNLTNLSAELYGNYRFSSGTPVAVADIEYYDNSFTGTLELPDIDEGYYTLYIKNGDEYISSISVHAENYKKPAYKLTAESDKKAIFYGDSTEYTLNTSFFDGTVLPELDISYNAGGAYFERVSDSIKTDSRGEAKITLTPAFSDSDEPYSVCDFRFSAYAVFPEIGDIHTDSSFRVFYNNIEVTAECSFKNGESLIRLHSDTITLDRLNDATAENYSDYIDKPDARRTINGTLYFNRYVKHEDGTYYDYFQKKTVTRYRYETEPEIVSTVPLTTDSGGNAEYSFKPENSAKDGYYTFEISAYDDMGRAYTNISYVPTNDITVRPYNFYSDDEYCTALNKENFDIGDEAVITVTKGMEKVSNPILFIKDFNGIKDIRLVNDGVYKTTFSELPGAYIYGTVFEPRAGYKSIVYERLNYNIENSRLDFEVTSDKDKYLPGDDCTLNIKVKDKNGDGVKADINISVVDEAILALAPIYSDTAEQLFGEYLPATVYSVYMSHNAQLNYRKFSGGGSITAASKEESADYAMANDAGGAVTLRSDFKDTAFYKTVQSNEDGTASVNFKLPDNITSWCAVISGVTEKLDAGSCQYPINVSMPAFISCNTASSYLVGDKPKVGVSVYGGELDGSENVRVVLTCDCDQSWESSAEGKAFERINIDMPTLISEGEYAVRLTAYVNDTPVDAVEMKFEVTDTYNRTYQAEFYSSPFDRIKSGGYGNVDIVFTDKTKAALADDMLCLSRCGGDRLDMQTASYTAATLWNEVFDTNLEVTLPDFKAYQNYDGGMKLLTHGDSDPDITAALVPYIKDYVNTDALKNYFINVGNNAKALYGLAVLREPVMNELALIAETDNLSAVEYLYIALAYCTLGETDTAAEIFERRITPLIESLEPLKRVRTGEDNDDINEATALAALTALYTDNKDAGALYEYCMSHFDSDISTNIYKLNYISTALKALPKENGTVKYSLYGTEHTIDFKKGEAHRVTVPAKNIDDFNVISASDSAAMLSVSKEKLFIAPTDGTDVRISRHYYKNGTDEKTTAFKENDIVRVELDVEFDTAAPNGGYCINDYLPSGLAVIESMSRDTRASESDGQRVTHYAWYSGKSDDDDIHKHFTYYARVINPGEFSADSAVILHSGSNNILAATDKEVISID